LLSRMSRLLALSRRELAALAAAFALTLPAVTARVYASDEIQYLSYLRSLWFDRDVSFENEYRYFYERHIGRGEGFHATFLELQTDTGLRPNFGTIGAAILWAPFYGVGDISARLMHAAGREIAVDGFSKPYIAAIAYGSAFYGFAAVVLGASAARLLRAFGAPALAEAPAGKPSPEPPAPSSDVIAAVLVWIGTPLLFYMYVAPPYAHAASAFAVALFVWLWLRVRRTWSVRGAVALGLSAALMAMVREQDVFFALGPAADFLLTAARGGMKSDDRGHYVKAAAAGLSAFVIAYLPQLLAYSALNGYPGPSKLVVRKMLWHSPHALQVIASPEHGFFMWTPLALLAIAGLVVLALQGNPDTRRVGACALLMVALQIYVSGSVDSWTVAGAFGQRRFVAVTVLLVIGLAALVRRVPRGAPKAAIAVVIALCVWWNLALTAAFGTGLMDRQRLQLRRNAYDAFVTVPGMAPQLAVQYLTKRDSFYKQQPQ
jgi:hypothetical protein